MCLLYEDMWSEWPRTIWRSAVSSPVSEMTKFFDSYRKPKPVSPLWASLLSQGSTISLSWLFLSPYDLLCLVGLVRWVRKDALRFVTPYRSTTHSIRSISVAMLLV